MARERFINARRGGFTTIINSMLDDPTLSLQAKGLLSIFLSNSNDWEIHMKEIIKRSKNGRDAHYKAINELIDNGYFFRTQVMEKGKFKEMIYIFSDNKEDVQAAMKQLDKQGISSHTENQETESKQPLPEKPYPVFPYPENQYNNNTKVNKTNFKNTNISMYVSTAGPDLQSINLFKKNYKLTSYAKESLESFSMKYGEELTLHAVERTIKKGKEENMISYIDGMLKKWAEIGLKSVGEIEAHEKTYWQAKANKAIQQKKQKKQSYNMKQSKLPVSIKLGGQETAATLQTDLTEEELQGTYADIQATMKFLRSTEKQVLHNKE